MNFWHLVAGAGIATAVAYVFILPDGKKSRRGRKGLPPGVLNIGNTCFLNSLLQALAACTSCLTWLEAAGRRSNKNGTGSLMQCLQKFLTALNPTVWDDNEDTAFLVPDEFMSCLRSHGWVFPPYHEQDAYELYHMILVTLSEELEWSSRPLDRGLQHSILQGSDSAGISSGGIEGRIRTPVDSHHISAAAKTRPVFLGRLAGRMQCMSCGFKPPLKLEDFDSLNLGFPALKKGPHTVESLISRFLMAESVSDVSCDSCTNIRGFSIKSSFMKQLHFVKLPHCLCIHVQRCIWQTHGAAPAKRHDAVLFKEHLDMSQFLHRLGRSAGSSGSHNTSSFISSTTGGSDSQVVCDPVVCGSSFVSRSAAIDGRLETVRDSRHHYRLVSVIAHQGDVDSGHFVTYRRLAGNRYGNTCWVHTSDADVRYAANEEVFACQPYMLFYERLVLR